MPTQRDIRPNERGQALTEIALCLPILCVLLMAIAQYGVMIWRDMELTSATRDGARRAVVARVEPNPTQSVIDATRGSLDTISPGTVNITVTGGWDRDDQVTVRATAPYSLDIFGLEVWSGRIGSTSTVRIG
jgi:Flp pilus assembly protein TadG